MPLEGEALVSVGIRFRSPVLILSSHRLLRICESSINILWNLLQRASFHPDLDFLPAPYHRINRYLGSEFPQILAKANVEYQQANLTVPGLSIPPLNFFLGNRLLPPAIVSSTFDPLPGQEPYSLVFDITGDVAYDRPEKVGYILIYHV